MTTYYIEQKITPFANQYKVFGAEGEAKGPLLAFVHQKRLALRENILFYADEAKTKLIFQIKTQKVLEVAATYQVVDKEGKLLGRLKKEFSSSLLRSTWSLLGPDGDQPLVAVRERSLPKAIVRRVWGLIPYIGDLPFFLKYHFDFVDKASGEVIGTYNKTTLVYDHYQLTVEDRLAELLDWRVLVALGVSLDALQSR